MSPTCKRSTDEEIAIEIGKKPQKDRLRTRKDWFPKGKGKGEFLKVGDT